LESSEQNYSTIEKEVKTAWNSINKFEVNLVNKKFQRRIDVLAMKKVLTKDIKKPGEAKFARWQAMFANFDFEVEHIKGKENHLPDFLSREFIQPIEYVMIIVTEWDQGQQKEVLRTIPDNLSWS